MRIETNRLMLREMTEDDYDSLYSVLADSDIMQHYPYTFDETRVRNWISKNIERYRIFGFGLWAVCLKETGEMIGDCGLTMQIIGGIIKPEIGYHIRKNKQRKGYAKETAIAVRDWTFNNTPFNVVFSYMKAANIPSAQTAISWGCRKVDEFIDEENETTNVFAVTREEWCCLQVLGKAVTVTVDRPLGSYHPKHNDIYYPINYGYVKGIVAQDGEERDAYILGVHKPVKEYKGKVIAVIHRLNDAEDKWVVAEENLNYSKEEIIRQTYFQEQCFEIEIYM